jgi:hypothetical protein
MALGAVSVVQKRYGPSPVWERLTLQFVYGFLGNLSGPTFDTEIFETTWEAFWEELSDPEWTWMGLANLRNFRSDTYDPLDLGYSFSTCFPLPSLSLSQSSYSWPSGMVALSRLEVPRI